MTQEFSSLETRKNNLSIAMSNLAPCYHCNKKKTNKTEKKKYQEDLKFTTFRQREDESLESIVGNNCTAKVKYYDFHWVW